MMGIDLYLTKGNVTIDMGRLHNFVGSSYVITPDIIKDCLENLPFEISDIRTRIMKFSLYRPSSLQDAREYMEDVENNLTYLREKWEQIERLRMLQDLLQQGFVASTD